MIAVSTEADQHAETVAQVRALRSQGFMLKEISERLEITLSRVVHYIYFKPKGPRKIARKKAEKPAPADGDRIHVNPAYSLVMEHVKGDPIKAPLAFASLCDSADQRGGTPSYDAIVTFGKAVGMDYSQSYALWCDKLESIYLKKLCYFEYSTWSLTTMYEGRIKLRLKHRTLAQFELDIPMDTSDVYGPALKQFRDIRNLYGENAQAWLVNESSEDNQEDCEELSC